MRSTSWFGFRARRVTWDEAEPGRRVEDDAHLRDGRRQRLARADEERHAGPAPVVDLESQGAERLRLRARRYAADIEVAAVLAADVPRRIGLGHRDEHVALAVVDDVDAATSGRLQRDEAQDLEQVVLHDVAHGADRVVEVAAAGDAEVLAHRDLHARDELPVPDRLEDRVREAEVEDVRDGHLPEVVVDPIELRLVDQGVQLLVERTCGGDVVSERFLDDDARILGQSRVREPADDRAEERRRDLEVEDRARLSRRPPSRPPRRSRRR